METRPPDSLAWAEGLGQLLCALNAGADREALADRILREALAATGALRGFLLGPGPEGELWPLSARRAGGEAIGRPMEELSRSLLTLAWREDRRVHVSASEDPRTMDLESVKDLGPGAVLVLPLRHQGQVAGALYLENVTPALFAAEAVARAQVLADCAALALARAGEERADLGRLAKDGRHAFPDVVGCNPRLLRCLAVARRVAATGIPVLLVGETGTGKELFARGIHRASPRSGGPFAAVNCGAIPAGLVESELFGHEAGSFTGAQGAHQGVFEQARGGTLFLDEVQALPLPVQAALLRALESGEVKRVGGEAALPVDVRIVAAANQDLEALVGGGSFRQDLYYRLKGLRIDVPPLRERREDIPILVEHFLARLRKKHGKPVVGLRSRAWAALMGHGYPGNVRELEHLIEHGVLLCPEDRIRLEDLPAELQGPGEEGGGPEAGGLPVPQNSAGLARAKRAVKSQLERLFVARALQQAGGNVSLAARQTGMHRVTLQKLVSRLLPRAGT